MAKYTFYCDDEKTGYDVILYQGYFCVNNNFTINCPILAECFRFCTMIL